MPCGWPPPLPAVRDLHLVTEVQSFLKRQRVGGHDGACGVRPVGPVPRLSRATSCTRPTPPTISPPMAVMMLTQSATASPFEVFVRPTAGRRRGSHAGHGEDEPRVPLTSRSHENPSSMLHGQGDDASASAQTPR
jgi:hypothetical protein